jgi:abortive infection bacteriophage resistance protein
MGRTATSIDQQLALLKSRNMTILDEDAARKTLADISYYRLGFYWFPFEKSYPSKHRRDHKMRRSSTFEDAVALYRFDMELRVILHRPLNRIETALKTKLIYHVSNRYRENPTWFADERIIDPLEAKVVERQIYRQIKSKYPIIARHHKHYTQDRFAPAWKAVEFMTFGEVVRLYKALKEVELKQQIADCFGVRQIVTFENYLTLIRDLRNTCAHGEVLYDYAPENSIRKGPAMMKGIGDNQNLNGALHVVRYLLRQISPDEHNALLSATDKLVASAAKNPTLHHILEKISGFKLQAQPSQP